MIYRDQLGDEIELKTVPRRIVSLVPSQTELLYDLGVKPIAQTIFCIHPRNEFKSSIKIGGTKKLNIEKIRSLKPDLIIGNKEENVKDQIDELRSVCPVWMSDVNTVSDAVEMIKTVGQMIGKEAESEEMSQRIQDGFNRLLSLNSEKLNCIYLIWNDPIMAVGTGTYINDVMQYAGYKNLVNDNRYPMLNDEQIQTINPDVILLSTEPFPFKEEHRMDFQKRFPNSEVKIVDAELYSWYGSRMLKAAELLSMKNEK